MERTAAPWELFPSRVIRTAWRRTLSASSRVSSEDASLPALNPASPAGNPGPHGGFPLLAETEAHLVAPFFRDRIERGAGNGGDPRDPDQLPAEGDVIHRPHLVHEVPHVRNHVICAAGHAGAKSRPAQQVEKERPRLGITGPKVPVVFVGQRQPGDRRVLQRGGRADGEEIVNLPDPAGDGFARDRPSHSPPRDRISLGDGVDRDRPVRHAGKRGEGDVRGVVVYDVLVDLVGDGVAVPLQAKRRDLPELLPGEDLPRRVVRGVDHHRLRLRIVRGPQLRRVVGPAGGVKRHVSGRRAREDAIRAVILVERLEDDDFVPRVDQRLQRGHHRFRGAAGHRDLRLRVALDPVEASGFSGDRLAELRLSEGHRVLVPPPAHGGHRGFLEILRTLEIREPL